MDQRLVTALQSVGSMSKQEAATALVSAFVAIGAERHPVRAARDRFSAIVTKSRKGTLQLIGVRPRNVMVVISLVDLVDIVRVAAVGKQSLGEALDAAGFRPASGKKMAVRQGFPQEPLVRKRSAKKSGGE